MNSQVVCLFSSLIILFFPHYHRLHRKFLEVKSECTTCSSSRKMPKTLTASRNNSARRQRTTKERWEFWALVLFAWFIAHQNLVLNSVRTARMQSGIENWYSIWIEICTWIQGLNCFTIESCLLCEWVVDDNKIDYLVFWELFSTQFDSNTNNNNCKLKPKWVIDETFQLSHCGDLLMHSVWLALP